MPSLPSIDLLREAVFPHTKKVFTHRLRITEAAQLDESIAALVQEAYDEIGPGTRSR